MKNHFKEMQLLLENMGVEMTVLDRESYKRIEFVDSRGDQATFFFDSDGYCMKKLSRTEEAFG